MVQNSDRAAQKANAIATRHTPSGFRKRPSTIVVITAAARAASPNALLADPTTGSETESHGTVNTYSHSRYRVVLRIHAKHRLELVDHRLQRVWQQRPGRQGKPWTGESPGDRSRQRRDIADRHEGTERATAKNLARTAFAVGRYHGCANGHALNQHGRQSLIVGRQREHTGPCHARV